MKYLCEIQQFLNFNLFLFLLNPHKANKLSIKLNIKEINKIKQEIKFDVQQLFSLTWFLLC